jgi:hypothetical protein
MSTPKQPGNEAAAGHESQVPKGGDSVDCLVGLIPEIGQAWERGEQRMEIADISARRVWLFFRRHADDVGEYHWRSREKWADVVRTSMAVKGTKYIPANDEMRNPQP